MVRGGRGGTRRTATAGKGGSVKQAIWRSANRGIWGIWCDLGGGGGEGGISFFDPRRTRRGAENCFFDPRGRRRSAEDGRCLNCDFALSRRHLCADARREKRHWSAEDAEERGERQRQGRAEASNRPFGEAQTGGFGGFGVMKGDGGGEGSARKTLNNNNDPLGEYAHEYPLHPT